MHIACVGVSRREPDHNPTDSYCLFFFKQKTAYDIGLGIPAEPLFRSTKANLGPEPNSAKQCHISRMRFVNEIGRASCRERGEISVVAGSLKKKKTRGAIGPGRPGAADAHVAPAPRDHHHD